MCLQRKLLIPLKENNFSTEANVLKQVKDRVPLGGWIGFKPQNVFPSHKCGIQLCCGCMCVWVCVYLCVIASVYVCECVQKPFLPKGNGKLKNTSKKVQWKLLYLYDKKSREKKNVFSDLCLLIFGESELGNWVG